MWDTEPRWLLTPPKLNIWRVLYTNNLTVQLRSLIQNWLGLATTLSACRWVLIYSLLPPLLHSKATKLDHLSFLCPCDSLPVRKMAYIEWGCILHLGVCLGFLRFQVGLRLNMNSPTLPKFGRLNLGNLKGWPVGLNPSRVSMRQKFLYSYVSKEVFCHVRP